MNLIYCTDNCKFQKDGYCTLKDTHKAQNITNSTNNCVYFIPKKSIITKK